MSSSCTRESAGPGTVVGRCASRRPAARFWPSRVGRTSPRAAGPLLDEPDLVDAVPEAGHVRFVAADGIGHKWEHGALAGDSVKPVEAKFEDGFMVLLRQASAAHSRSLVRITAGPRHRKPGAMKRSSKCRISSARSARLPQSITSASRCIAAKSSVCSGPTGRARRPTFRMLCGLLAATRRHAAGRRSRLALCSRSARQQIGYVAQKFSLYGQISVLENLDFFASAYGLRGRRRRERIEWALEQFELSATHATAQRPTPGGFKQRLSMAAALLHEPETLFLDEPTSGVDPLARREFWRRITALAQQGVTVIVTTHFMEEAEYCDRIAIWMPARCWRKGTPAEVRADARPEPGRSPNDGRRVHRHRRKSGRATMRRKVPPHRGPPCPVPTTAAGSQVAHAASASRSVAGKEGRQILRDPSSIAIGIVLPVILILLFGYGLSLDVKDVPVAMVIEDPSPEADGDGRRFSAVAIFPSPCYAVDDRGHAS